MASTRFTKRVLASLAVGAGVGPAAVAQPPALTVQQAFEAKPRQPGVVVATPPADQFGQYRVDPIPNPKQAGTNMGYVVRDAQNRTVRQFVSYDDKQFNIIAFYTDGQEAYREVYPPTPTVPYQFRWLGPNGGKWGMDHDRDGRIDEWVVISQAEVSQELLQAVIARDAKRLEALFPTKENLETLGLPPAEAAKVRDKTAGAAKRLIATADALDLSPAAKWVHLEVGVPRTTPADSFGGRDDLVIQPNGTVLIEDGGKTHFLQTGELLMVGRGWKVIEGPAAGPAAPGGAGDMATGPVITPEIAELVRQLDAHDKAAPNPPTRPALADYYAKRAELLDQIVQKMPANQQADWTKLLIDSLAAAVEGGQPDTPSHQKLKQIKAALAGTPDNPLAGYAAFRLLVAENGMALANAKGGDELQKVQEKWRSALAEFVKAYPDTEDTGEAVIRLAMAHEFAGADGEAKAKEWYTYLAEKLPTHRHAAKAGGAIKRLDAEGKPLDLNGPVLGTGQAFSAGQLAGKPVVVYYWASWSSTLADDAKKLKELAATYGPKGLQIVTVALDDDPQQAAQSVRATGLPGTHLHARGGLDASPLAAGYGIMVVPHILLADKTGKVVDRNAQLTTLEDEVKKLVE